MKEIEVCRKNIHWEDGSNHEVIYYITSEDILAELGVTVAESYGVGIRILDGDDEHIPGITSSARKITALVDILASGTVTPVGLRDVLCEILEDVI